jgi:tetratricopeptide (TPR) repeat protein
VLLALCLAAKLLSLGVLAGNAAARYAAGDAAGVDAAASGLGMANVVEQHKAPFAAGSAAVLRGDYGAARTDFETALRTLPAGSGDECLIRVNLALAIERLGDEQLQAGDPASAAALYQAALSAAKEAPGCLSPDAAAGAGGRLGEAAERLEGKLNSAAQAPGQTPAPPKDPAPDPSAEARQSQLDQLQDSSRQAERERNSGREREQYLDDANGTAPERPW